SPSLGVQQGFGFGLRFLDLQFAVFFLASLAGWFFRLVWECLKRSHLLELPTRRGDLRRYRLAIVFSGTGLFFQFFKSVIFFVLLVQRFGLVLGKQRLIFGKTSCDPGRFIGMLSRSGTPTSRPGRLLQTLVFRNGLARENDGLVSRRRAVFRTSALMRATFGAA